MNRPSKAVVVLSGGMDSAAALYQTINELGEHSSVHTISFNYGQRHSKELDSAAYLSEIAGAKDHKEVDIRSITDLISNSVLTTHDNDVPEGHYADDNMKQTVVPNRNSIMLNIAAGYAVNIGAEYLVTGVHSGDHAVYPDCRPEFIRRLEDLLLVANEGFIAPSFTVHAPWLHVEKSEIAYRGELLGVPWHVTWTCYKGGKTHCGRCATCVERLEAIDAASKRIGYSIRDVEYEDVDYWRGVVA